MHKNIIIENGKLLTNNVYMSYGDVVYRKKISLKSVRITRNRDKLLKTYINGKYIGYILLDKSNRNLYIEGNIFNLSTNY